MKTLANLTTAQRTEAIAAMREWVADCTWRDIEDADDIAALSDVAIVRGVERHYDGGVEWFLRASLPGYGE